MWDIAMVRNGAAFWVVGDKVAHYRILSAVDKRLKAAVLMAGVAETADIILYSDAAGLAELRKSQPPGQLEKCVQVTSDLDAIRFVGHAAPVSLLLQFA